MLYRIVTECKNKGDVLNILSRHFAGFTVLEGHSYWKAQPERSLIAEIETDDEQEVTDAAVEIKQRNLQQAVMIQRIPNCAWLV